VIRIGVDIGGTFTDFVLLRTGEGAAGEVELRTRKRLSTPDDPARAVLEGLEELLARVGGEGDAGEGEERERDGDGASGPVEISLVHGSTVATNALLERDGARSALVTTQGFGDLLLLARQDRPRIYDLFEDRPPPLVPPERCFEVAERISAGGEVVGALRDGEIARLIEALRRAEVESVAVCLLFSFLRPEHEERIGTALRAAGFRVSLSSEVLPEFREYERASTTAIDAYVSPVLDRYLARIDRERPAGRFRVMGSDGGAMGVEAARRHGVRSVLSGPAGGVVGAVEVARAIGEGPILTFDMGGTSTDVSLSEGEPRMTREAEIGGLPVAVRVVDLHTVGSGGGSVAWVDPGGALRVGPRSAGADPGPVCYGRGGARPTVTDAHLVLGRLDPGLFLGGRISLDLGAAREALARLAAEAGLDTAPPEGSEDAPDPAERAALGVIGVANATMERALRVVSVERGRDPARLTLVSFGGAGGLHASALARRLGVRRVLVPPAAATLSALGMLAADVVVRVGRTVMLAGEEASRDRLARIVGELREEGDAALAREGIPEERRSLPARLDVRYRGQSYELTVPYGSGEGGGGWRARFHAAHRRRFGHSDADDPLEVVNVRVRATGHIPRPPLPSAGTGRPDPSGALAGEREVVLEVRDGGAPATGEPVRHRVPFYRGDDLRPGHELRGPAVVVRPDTTVLLEPGDSGRVDRFGNLVLHPAGEGTGG